MPTSLIEAIFIGIGGLLKPVEGSITKGNGYIYGSTEPSTMLQQTFNTYEDRFNETCGTINKLPTMQFEAYTYTQNSLMLCLRAYEA